jgi:hypothetical protein
VTTPKAPALLDLPESDGALLEPAQEAVLARALRSAYAPGELLPARHAEILRATLEDPFAAPTADELRESARLRRALEDGDVSHPDAALGRALAAAMSPAPLAEAAGAELARSVDRRKPNVVFVAFGALGLAAAAAFALFVARPRAPEHEAVPALARSRSTQELFREPFDPKRTSERIDRIAEARARDARENRYALWGVR